MGKDSVTGPMASAEQIIATLGTANAFEQRIATENNGSGKIRVYPVSRSFRVHRNDQPILAKR